MPVQRVPPTCWTVQCWTVSAVSLATPGSSLRCCSQQSDRSRPGWADMADRKMDWWRAACRLVSAGAGGQKDQPKMETPGLGGPQGEGTRGITCCTWVNGRHFQLLLFLFHTEEFAWLAQPEGGEGDY